ncbi:MAG TPA: helix-turn-helix domain-containing protein [Thermomicrobiales bacterium]|nr:helix-turn-helix domain-containing protein [Thermomicrobiales bacterium]
MNITLRDVVRWPESPLYAAGGAGGTPDAALRHPDHEVSWPVLMRATAPMLPHLDQGALVLLSPATLAEVRPILPGVLRELRQRGAVALVADPDEDLDADDLDLLRARERIGPDLEAALIRLVNGRRTRLYQRGTEVDHALTEATLRGQGIGRLLAIGAAQSGRDVFLLDGQGRVREAGGAVGLPPREAPRPPAPSPDVDTPPAPVPDAARGVEWLLCPLGGGLPGWVALRGPLGALDEVDRLVGRRVAAACALALERAPAARGAARLSPVRRAALTADLLRPDLPPAERAAHAEALGLDPAVPYAVLLIGARQDGEAAGTGPQALRRAVAGRIAPYVTAEAFDARNGAAGLLLGVAGPEELHRVARAARDAVARDPAGAVAALGETVGGLAAAPASARQARFALALLRGGALAGPLADWHEFDDLGVYHLLYPLWGTPAAERFVAEVLGGLPAYDERHGGELLPTLAAYLRHGEAATAAAADLAIHRNTLTYRLRRIAELTGRSPLDPAQQLPLHLAALLSQLPPAE